MSRHCTTSFIMAKKHKKKRIYTTSITSNISSDRTRYYRTRFNVFRACIIVTVLSLIVAGLATWYVLTQFVEMEEQVSTLRSIVSTQQDTIISMGAERAELEERNQILSVTVGKQEVAREEQETIKKERAIPNAFPLTDSAEIVEQDTEKDDYVPIAVFNMSALSDVVATADGVVTSVREDSVYGNCIIVDHDNGYQTLYKYKTAPKVTEGDEVVRGAILYIGVESEESDDEDDEEEQNLFAYQITYMDQFTDPMELIDIEG